MNNANEVPRIPIYKKWLGWAIHAFTASGAFIGLLSLFAIYEQEYLSAFWLMFMTVLIDSIDGCLARYVDIKVVVPKMDGALLDNIVDFLTYTIVPAFFYWYLRSCRSIGDLFVFLPSPFHLLINFVKLMLRHRIIFSKGFLAIGILRFFIYFFGK